MVLLLVAGVMDDARADILGAGNISLSFVEHFSQVCSVLLYMLSYLCMVLCMCGSFAHTETDT